MEQTERAAAEPTPESQGVRAVVSSDLLPVPNVKRPILRYHGGKWAIAKWIISHFPKHRIYTEAFGGAASILLQKPRSYSEIYNDLYGDVVNLFRVLRDAEKSAQLADALELTPYSRQEFIRAYEPTADEVESARKLVVRSFMGFGTKVAKNSEANGFRGGAKCLRQSVADEWSRMPVNVRAVAARMVGVVIEQRPATAVLTQYDTAETLHYVDPPYVKDSRGDDGDDYAHEMTDEQHRQLAKVLNGLKGAVIVSGYGSKLYDELFAGWRREELNTLADGARKRTEILWMRNVTTDATLWTGNAEFRNAASGAPGLDGGVQ